MKYYFVSSMYRWTYNAKSPMPFEVQSSVTEMHPFEFIDDLNNTVPNSETRLFGWQEITKEEYDLYKKLEL